MNESRIAVSMEIPMRISMDVDMRWVWRLKSNPGCSSGITMHINLLDAGCLRIVRAVRGTAERQGSEMFGIRAPRTARESYTHRPTAAGA